MSGAVLVLQLSHSPSRFCAVQLQVEVFDFKRLGADVSLGQAIVSLDRFQDGRPHYVWLELHKRHMRDARCALLLCKSCFCAKGPALP